MALNDPGGKLIADGTAAVANARAQHSQAVSDAQPRALAIGTVTLVAGTAAVTGLPLASANTVVVLASKTNGGTAGAVFVSARTAGTGFTVTSTNVADTSTIYYEVLSW